MKILVIGDAMLDISRFGPRVRTSPEQRSCWIVEETHQECGLGGAANVARWLAAQPEHEVTLMAAHGNDSASEQLRVLCQANAIRVSQRLFDPGISTTVKERVIIEDSEKERTHQCLRIDRDSLGFLRPNILAPLQHELWTKGRYDAIVAVDYGKRVFREQTGIDIMRLLAATDIPVFVNSKQPAYWAPFAVTAVLCNQQEMVDSLQCHDVRKARERLLAQQLVVTQGAGGVTGVLEDAPIHRLAPATEVVDVIGCGDAFLAGFAHGSMRYAKHHLRRLQPVEFVDLLDEGQRWAAHCLGQVGCGNPLVAAEVRHG